MITESLSASFDGVSSEIWASMVNIPLTLVESKPGAVVCRAAVAASIQIVGPWNGAACIYMGEELARHATASLLGAEAPEVSRLEIRDAAAELANMTGGGIKELLPEICQISLPAVVMGMDFEVNIPKGVVVYRSIFRSDFGDLTVTLTEGAKRRFNLPVRGGHQPIA